MMTLTPAPARPSSPGFRSRRRTIAKAASPKVRLRLAAARGEEEEIDRLAIRVSRIDHAREVQQQEGKLEGSPREFAFDSAPRQRLPDRPVRQPKGVQRVGVPGERFDSALHAIRRQACLIEQLLRSRPTLLRECAAPRPPFVDPAPVFRHEGGQGRRGGLTVAQGAQRIHGEFDAGHLVRSRGFDLSAPDPCRPHLPALALLHRPVRGDPVPGGVGGGVGVMQIGHPVVPLLVRAGAHIRPRMEGGIGLHRDHGLEGVGRVGIATFGCGGATVRQEHRHGARPGLDSPREGLGRDATLPHVQRQTVRLRHRLRVPRLVAVELQHDLARARRPTPHLNISALAVFLF